MIRLVETKAYECSCCGWLWFNHQGKGEPKRCPRRNCRALAGTVRKNKPKAPVAPLEAAIVTRCKRCDTPVLRDPKNAKYWLCRQCRRQLSDHEVRVETTA